MALSRLNVLDTTLNNAGIPFASVTLGDNPPSTVVVSYSPEVTQQQIDAAQSIIDSFDYRPRQDLSPGAIATQIAALTVAQEVALRRRILARVLLAHQQDAQDLITALALPLAVDEVVPS